MSQNPVLNPLPPHPLRNSPKHKDSSQPANTPLPRDSEAPQRLEDTIPDNGLRAWLQCAGSFFLLLASFGLINSFGLSLRPLLYPHFPSSLSAYPLTVLGVFQTYYQRTLLPTSTPFQIAWIGSLQAALLISLRIIAGPFYDRGYLRSLLVVGGVLLVVGMLMTGLCSQYWQLLLAQGVMVGLGSGCLFLPSIAVLPQYFKKKRALATGIGSSGSAIGAICFPIMFNKLEPRIGFRYATWLIALVILVSLVIPIATIRMRELPKEARPLFDARALREGPFLLWGGYLFVSLLGLYLPSFFIQLYGIRFVNASLAFDLLPVLNAGSFFGRLVPLYIADKIGPLNVEILLTIAGSILAFSWLAVCDAAPLFIFSALYGFFAGAITTVTAVIDAALCPTLDVVGVRMGMLLVPWALGLLVGEPIAGAILASGGGWMGLQIFAGAVIVAAVALGIAVRVSKYGWGLRTKC